MVCSLDQNEPDPWSLPREFTPTPRITSKTCPKMPLQSLIHSWVVLALTLNLTPRVLSKRWPKRPTSKLMYSWVRLTLAQGGSVDCGFIFFVGWITVGSFFMYKTYSFLGWFKSHQGSSVGRAHFWMRNYRTEVVISRGWINKVLLQDGSTGWWVVTYLGGSKQTTRKPKKQNWSPTQFLHKTLRIVGYT